MFLVFPVGVDDATVDRVPWVSIAVAAACVASFFITWVVPESPLGVSDGDLLRIVERWHSRPYLELPQPIRERLSPRLLARLEKERLSPGEIAPDPAMRALEQSELETMAGEYLARAEQSTLRRFSLVPSRGAAQVGWLTGMFLHFGWLHLLGNLFFFYLVGPLLEDIWGRPIFGAFYLVGGLSASIAQAALDRGSSIMILGASGAIAACMGAFTLRFALRRIRMAYLIWFIGIFRGTFRMPAWLWGLFWFGSEVASFATGSYQGVAVMAHIAGFAFGFAVALTMKVSGAEARLVAPAVEQKVAWVQHPDISAALDLCDRGDRAAATERLKALLTRQPEHPEASFTLGRLLLEDGDRDSGMRQIERAIGAWVAAPSQERMWGALSELGPLFDSRRLRPHIAYRLASAVEASETAPRQLALPLYQTAAGSEGIIGAKALLRAKFAFARGLPAIPECRRARRNVLWGIGSFDLTPTYAERLRPSASSGCPDPSNHTGAD